MLKALMYVEGRRGNGEKDIEHIASSSSKGWSLTGTETQGQSWEIHLFLEYTDVFGHTMAGKSSLKITLMLGVHFKISI